MGDFQLAFEFLIVDFMLFPAERQELFFVAKLLITKNGIFFGLFCLTFKALDLFKDFLSKIPEPIQVLLGMAHSQLGFVTPFLVF